MFQGVQRAPAARGEPNCGPACALGPAGGNGRHLASQLCLRNSDCWPTEISVSSWRQQCCRHFPTRGRRCGRMKLCVRPSKTLNGISATRLLVWLFAQVFQHERSSLSYAVRRQTAGDAGGYLSEEKSCWKKFQAVGIEVFSTSLFLNYCHLCLIYHCHSAEEAQLDSTWKLSPVEKQLIACLRFRQKAPAFVVPRAYTRDQMVTEPLLHYLPTTVGIPHPQTTSSNLKRRAVGPCLTGLDHHL